MPELPGELAVPEDQYLTREQAEADPTVDIHERPLVGLLRLIRERNRRNSRDD